jgi:hypothetical protein
MFPNPLKYPARFREWLRRMGNVYLFDIDQMKVYNGYTVCASTFQTFRLRHEQWNEKYGNT